MGARVSAAVADPDPLYAWVADGKPYVPVPGQNAVPDDPSRPYCAWCGRNNPPGGLVDESAGGPPVHSCPDSEQGTCDGLRDSKMPSWIETWYPRLHDSGYRYVRRTQWGQLQLWRDPAEAQRWGFNDLARPSALDERREQAAREEVRKWAEQRAREILTRPEPEPAYAAAVPSPAPVVTAADFESANWHGTIRGNPAAHRHHTLANPAHRTHLISGGAVYYARGTDLALHE